MERKYMMYEGEETNTIDLLYETTTDEPNGVKVIVPVNYSDRHEFETKIEEQLAYFESVYFDVCDLDNDFSIVRSENFQHSPIAKDNYLHICLDNVYYPLDAQKLGIQSMKFPIGLRFSLTDGIFPTPNREAIRYTKEAKEMILKKLELVATYFVQKYNDSVEETENFMQVLEYYQKTSRFVDVFGVSLDVSIIRNYSTIPICKPVMKNIKHLDLEKLVSNKDFVLGEYSVNYKISGNRLKENKHYYDKMVRIGDITKDNFLIYENKLSGMMKDYVKFKYPSGRWSDNKYICKKTKPYKLGGATSTVGTRVSEYSTYYDILQLRKFPKNQWREVIKEFKYIVSSTVSNFIKIDDIVIPQAWIDSRKKTKVTVLSNSKRRLKLKGEIVGKELKGLERDVQGKNSKQVSTIYDLEKIHQQKRLMVYGKADDANTMDKLFSVVKSTTVGFIVFSEREIKNLEQIKIHNWMSIETFMKGENKPFKRIVTAFLINKLIMLYRQSFERQEHLNGVSTTLRDKMRLLYDYRDSYFVNGNDQIFDSMIELAENNNLFDTEIYSTYLEVKNLFEKLPFINTLLAQYSRYGKNEALESIMVDMFKYYRHRIDWKKYGITIEEKVSEEALTDEMIDELCID